jgi:ELWxxDGT repeat protein
MFKFLSSLVYNALYSSGPRLPRRRPACEPLESRMLLSGASLVKDINPGTGSSLALSSTQEAALGNKFIFAANDGMHGFAPWVSDGTDPGTIMLANTGVNPGSFVAANGVVYFSAGQVWKTDGTVAGTAPFAAVPSSPDARNSVFVVPTGPNVFFTEDGDNQTSSLWVVPAAGGAAQELTNFGGISNSLPIPLGAVNGLLFFDASNANAEDTLWVSDGTPGGTGPITINPNSQFLDPYGSAFISPPGVIFNGQLFFNAFNGNSMTGTQGLWKSNGTQAGTLQVGSTGFTSTDPQNYTVVGNTLYFIAATDATGTQLWSTDGATITQVTNLNTTTGSIQNLTNVNGTLFFSASTGGTPKVLYHLVNGTPTQVPLPADGSGTVANQLTNVNGTLFFSAQNASGQQVLFDSDGTSINKVFGNTGSTPLALFNVNGTLFYEASDPATGSELYSATPTGTSTVSLDVTSPIDIDEGDKMRVKFHAMLTGATASKWAWDFTGTGKYVQFAGKAGATPSYSYTKFSPGIVVVHVAVRTTDGRKFTDQVQLNINNAAPEVKLKAIVPRSHVLMRLLPISFTATWKDPGFQDEFTVDWELDQITPTPTGYTTTTIATFEDPVTKAHAAHWTKAILGAGLQYSATVKVTDKDGGAGSDLKLLGVIK